MRDATGFNYFDVTAIYTDEDGRRMRETFTTEARTKAEADGMIREQLRDDKDVIINRIREQGRHTWLERLIGGITSRKGRPAG
jgi:hypothetical protein